MKRAEKFDFLERVDRGIKRGIAQAFAAHRKSGEKVVIWENCRILEIVPPLPHAKKH